MAEFAARRTTQLLTSAVPSAAARPISPQSTSSDAKQTLRALLVSLNPPIDTTSNAAEKAIRKLKALDVSRSRDFGASDEEEAALEAAVLARVAVALYAQAVSACLSEAADAETEAEWWSDNVRSRWDTLWYLLPSLPFRLQNIIHEILNKLQSLNIRVSPSAFTPSSIRRLFPSPGAFRPGPLLSAAYPHLRTHPHAMSLALSRPEIQFSLRDTQTLSSLRAQGMWLHTWITNGLLLPLDLAAQECEIKRKQLQRIRDERASALGRLLRLQNAMERLVNTATSSGSKSSSQALQQDFGEAMFELAQAIGGEGYFTPSGQSPVLLLSQLATQTLPQLNADHAHFMTSNALRRPSRLARRWPRLFLLPPLALFAVRYAYNSRASLAELAAATAETLDRFWHDWLLEPLQDVVRTVRAGSEERVLVSARGVAADVESLERMSLALAKEKLGYSATQLEELANLVKEGDLTPVLRIYEEDIKNPLRSAVSGTLLRSVFIQVQKAKVDIDQALSGIDKLLKSQELTFAFVGVAPAFALVYTASGLVYNVFSGGSRSGRYGGRRRRVRAWLAIRRIERLLLTSIPDAESAAGLTSIKPTAVAEGITPLTAGLLLLSVTHLRAYAEGFLPKGSRVREGVLEDVTDLEDSTLGKDAKLRVVDRMWRNWGNELGWSTLGEH